MNGISAGADIISVKVLDPNGEGSWSGLVFALDHVIKFAKRGDVILMSLGANVTGCSSEAPVLGELIQEIGSRGVFVVMSAGNDSGNAEITFPDVSMAQMYLLWLPLTQVVRMESAGVRATRISVPLLIVLLTETTFSQLSPVIHIK